MVLILISLYANVLLNIYAVNVQQKFDLLSYKSIVHDLRADVTILDSNLFICFLHANVYCETPYVGPSVCQSANASLCLFLFGGGLRGFLGHR